MMMISTYTNLIGKLLIIVSFDVNHRIFPLGFVLVEEKNQLQLDMVLRLH
jgi:hypothetical protein